MSAEKLTDQQYENLRVVYQQLGSSLRSLEGFRAKLLVFLPCVTGGMFLLLNTLNDETRQFIGIFGFVITVGLYFYEFLVNVRCDHLVTVGRQLEGRLAINGPYTERPVGIAGFASEAYLARVIYPTVLAAWTFLAFVLNGRPVALLMAFVVLAIFFVVPRLLKLGRWPI